MTRGVDAAVGSSFVVHGLAVGRSADRRAMDTTHRISTRRRIAVIALGLIVATLAAGSLRHGEGVDHELEEELEGIAGRDKALVNDRPDHRGGIRARELPARRVRQAAAVPRRSAHDRSGLPLRPRGDP